MITTQQLISGKPIKCIGLGTLVPPTIGKIFELSNECNLTNETKVQDKYLLYLNILRMNLQEFLKISGLEKFYEQIPQSELSLYDFLIIQDDMRKLLSECFSFFIAEKVSFNEERLCFDVINDNNELIGEINKDNFDAVRFNLLRLNCVSAKEIKPVKFRNKRAKEVYESCRKKRAEFEQTSTKNSSSDAKYDFENLVAYVATKSPNYNFFNIGGLTIYQFNMAFHKQNLYNQLDTNTKRWATWGKDNFDFSAWYENIEILK